MKLNFRSVDSGGTLAHGVTPVLIPPLSSGTLSSRSAPAQGQGTLASKEGCGSGHIAGGTAGSSSRTRRCNISCGTGMLCVLVVAVVCLLPSVLPAAVRHVERLVDWSGVRAQGALGRAGEVGKEGGSATGGGTGSRALVPTVEERREEMGGPRMGNGRVELGRTALPVSAATETQSGREERRDGGAGMQARQDQRVDGSKYRFNSYGVAETGRRAYVEAMRLQPIVDGWNRYVVVRHGKLYMSETFEARLNEEVARKIYARHPELFGHVQADCGGAGEVSFSFKTSPVVQAELEIVTQCGPTGSSCTLRPRIDDLRRLQVNVGAGGGGEHYLTAEGTSESERVTWGPLVGPLKVVLLEESLLALKKTCARERGGGTRIVSVGHVKAMLRELQGREGGSGFDVFRYDAQPHHHIDARRYN